MWSDRQLTEFFTSITPAHNEYDIDALGVEYEIEYRDGLMLDNLHVYLQGTLLWIVTADGSLRGNGFEYITRPDILEKHSKNLDLFERRVKSTLKVDDVSKVLKPSHRTSTHVHMNFTKDSVLEQLKFISLYYLFEQVFLELFTQDRKHNTYCISSNTIPYKIADNIAVKRKYTTSITEKENNKYASLNFSRLADLGTIECRLMHGFREKEETMHWLTILSELKQASRKNFNSLKDVDDKYLNIPCLDFIAMLFPTSFPVMLQKLQEKNVTLKEKLTEGYHSAFAILRYAALIDEGVALQPAAAVRRKKAIEEALLQEEKFINEVRQKAAAMPALGLHMQHFIDAAGFAVEGLQNARR